MRQYIIDTNTLTYLKAERRRTSFFRQKCFIPSAVLREARGFPDYSELCKREIPTDELILRKLKLVMSKLNTTDTRLVNLYKNEGNADPFIIATALAQEHKERETPGLFSLPWVVVSDDKAVRKAANHHDIDCFTSKQLADEIDALN